LANQAYANILLSPRALGHVAHIMAKAKVDAALGRPLPADPAAAVQATGTVAEAGVA
jgi:hypothetical protein